MVNFLIHVNLSGSLVPFVFEDEYYYYMESCCFSQRNAFRALRFLFSMERNRRLFKRLFPADVFTVFIDVGHYNKDLRAYKPLVEKINSLSVSIYNGLMQHKICPQLELTRLTRGKSWTVSHPRL